MNWMASMASMETIRVAGVYVAGEPPVRWISVPQLTGNAAVAVHFARLSALRHLAPDASPPSTDRIHIEVSLQVRLRRVDRQVRLIIQVADIDLSSIRPILDQITAGRTLTPSEQEEVAREVDAQVAALERQAHDQLRTTSAGTINIALDMSALRDVRRSGTGTL